ncbi:TetR/AcrR family transcriptional regulator [Halioxenophilus sp. WMMB6]|uniref:TetR/AcrR family transcriptional regulator n=1 Tax=Halioxenophilus sp. WMMB6 TaxID=3073815 RepID=UPI00295E91D9|nr:TetR/AcrR family transcriptional regulator [Halioxenophilus sp. WMMB6]
MLNSVESSCCPQKSKVRDRILEAAMGLFYRLGIKAVGVDAIVSEANTNKMSLYRNFESKDELVLEFVKAQEQTFRERWRAIMAEHAEDPKEQIKRIFEALVEKGLAGGSFGCSGANVAVELRGEEHPAVTHIQQTRAEVLSIFCQLAADAGATNPQQLGVTLVLLYEGCVLSRLSFAKEQWPALQVAEIVEQLLNQNCTQ